MIMLLIFQITSTEFIVTLQMGSTTEQSISTGKPIAVIMLIFLWTCETVAMELYGCLVFLTHQYTLLVFNIAMRKQVYDSRKKAYF